MTVTITIPSTSTPIGSAVATPSALATPTILLAPNIDPTTNDFVSVFTGMDPVDAAVINAIKIVRNSGPAVTDVGNRLSDVRKITKSTVNELKAEIRSALDLLIRKRDINYLGAIVDYNEPGQQFIQIRPRWINLRAFTGTVQSANIVVST
jgi:hypothetical protein